MKKENTVEGLESALRQRLIANAALLNLVAKYSPNDIGAWKSACLFQALALEEVCEALGIVVDDEAIPSVKETVKRMEDEKDAS